MWQSTRHSPVEEPLTHPKVALVLRLNARAKVAPDLFRPHREEGVEFISSMQASAFHVKGQRELDTYTP